MDEAVQTYIDAIPADRKPLFDPLQSPGGHQAGDPASNTVAFVALMAGSPSKRRAFPSTRVPVEMAAREAAGTDTGAARATGPVRESGGWAQ
jgi:hypothetical protein